MWYARFLRMDHRQCQWWIPLAFSDRRQDADLTVPDLKKSLIGIAFVGLHLDPMQTLDHDLVHLVGNRMVTLASSAVDTGPDEEMRFLLLR